MEDSTILIIAIGFFVIGCILTATLFIITDSLKTDSSFYYYNQSVYYCNRANYFRNITYELDRDLIYHTPKELNCSKLNIDFENG
jgi:hypothetical protein